MKQKKKLRFCAALGTLSLLTTTSGVYALTVTAEKSTVNTSQTSIVDIGLSTEFAESEDWKLMPGRKVEMKPVITNNGADCYIRLKMKSVTWMEETDEEGERMQGKQLVDVQDVFGLQEDWKVIGDYLYLKKPLKHGNSVAVFDGFCFSNAITSADAAGSEVEIGLDVDAIQSEFFTPDFDSSEPWGVVEVMKCTHEDGYDFTELRSASSSKLTVTYENAAEGILIEPEDLFSNIPAMVPGGSYTDQLELVNNDSLGTEIFFKTTVLDKENDFLQKTSLRIEYAHDGLTQVVYDGPYNSESLQQYLSLGRLETKESGTLFFTISVPPELDNTYTLREGSIQWDFRVVGELPVPTKDPDKDPDALPSLSPLPTRSPSDLTDLSPLPTRSPTGGSVTSGTASAVKTGDRSLGLLLTLTGLSGTVTAAGLFFSLKKKEAKEQE